MIEWTLLVIMAVIINGLVAYYLPKSITNEEVSYFL